MSTWKRQIKTIDSKMTNFRWNLVTLMQSRFTNVTLAMLIGEELEKSSLYTGVEPAENVTYKHLF